jgi:hypothetical protein
MTNRNSGSKPPQYHHQITKADLMVLRTHEQHTIWCSTEADNPHLAPILREIGRRRAWAPSERELRSWHVLSGAHPLDHLLGWIRSAPSLSILGWCWDRHWEEGKKAKREVGTLESITDILRRMTEDRST